MDSAFQLCNIKNLVIVANDDAKNSFLTHVYPHNIDCIVLTQEESKNYINKKYKVIFLGCYVKDFEDNENIVMDEIIYRAWSPKPYTLRWEPEELATFISCWFMQDKLRKTGNNLSFRFKEGKPTDGRFAWLRKIMY